MFLKKSIRSTQTSSRRDAHIYNRAQILSRQRDALVYAQAERETSSQENERGRQSVNSKSQYSQNSKI